jgi:hypothetical protein
MFGWLVHAYVIREMKHARWADAFVQTLLKQGRMPESLRTGRKGELSKRELASKLRIQAGAPHAWLAENLHMGSPNSVRAWLNLNTRDNMHISA